MSDLDRVGFINGNGEWQQFPKYGPVDTIEVRWVVRYAVEDIVDFLDQSENAADVYTFDDVMRVAKEWGSCEDNIPEPLYYDANHGRNLG